MSGREKKDEAADPREANQGICIKCRRLLPASSFMRDAAGCLTAWCSVCREEAAKNWGVEVDQVELVRALYLHEQAMKREAETVMQARVTMGQASAEESKALAGRIHNHHMIRHSRLRDRIRHLLADHREAWYNSVGMVAPDAHQSTVLAAE
ncbi:MAG: hypothetical protein ABIY63_13240 [Fibrobacteria bacterium]